MNEEGDDDWFGQGLLDASPSLAAHQARMDRERERVGHAARAARDYGRRGGRVDPNAAKTAAAAFTAVENGANPLGTHPGYAGAGVPPTIGGKRGEELPGKYKPVVLGQPVSRNSEPVKLEEVMQLIRIRLENEPLDRQRAEASRWLTALTKAISDFTRGLDEAEE